MSTPKPITAGQIKSLREMGMALAMPTDRIESFITKSDYPTASRAMQQFHLLIESNKAEVKSRRKLRQGALPSVRRYRKRRYMLHKSTLRMAMAGDIGRQVRFFLRDHTADSEALASAMNDHIEQDCLFEFICSEAIGFRFRPMRPVVSSLVRPR